MLIDANDLDDQQSVLVRLEAAHFRMLDRDGDSLCGKGMILLFLWMQLLMCAGSAVDKPTLIVN